MLLNLIENFFKEKSGATALLSILAAIIIGVFTASFIRTNTKSNIESELIVSMNKKEEEALNDALLATGR